MVIPSFPRHAGDSLPVRERGIFLCLVWHNFFSPEIDKISATEYLSKCVFGVAI